MFPNLETVKIDLVFSAKTENIIRVRSSATGL